MRVLHTLSCCFFLLCLFEANLSSVPLTSEADIYTRHLTIQFTQLILLTFLLSLSRGVPLDVLRAPNSVGSPNHISHAQINLGLGLSREANYTKGSIGRHKSRSHSSRRGRGLKLGTRLGIGFDIKSNFFLIDWLID